MSQELTAAVSIRRFMQMMKGLTELEPALSDLASVKQAADEAQVRVAKLHEDEQAAKAALSVANGAVEKAKALAKDIEKDAKVRADALVAAAEKRDKENAEHTKRTLSTLEDSANKKLREVQAAVKLAEGRLQFLQTEITDGEKRYSIMQKRIDEVVKSATRGIYDDHSS